MCRCQKKRYKLQRNFLQSVICLVMITHSHEIMSHCRTDVLAMSAVLCAAVCCAGLMLLLVNFSVRSERRFARSTSQSTALQEAGLRANFACTSQEASGCASPMLDSRHCRATVLKSEACTPGFASNSVRSFLQQVNAYDLCRLNGSRRNTSI